MLRSKILNLLNVRHVLCGGLLVWHSEPPSPELLAQ